MAAKTKFIFPKEGEARVIPWPCTIFMPVDGGKQEQQQITVRFKVIGADEVVKAARDLDAGLFETVVEGFVDFKDAEGNTVDDEKAKAALAKIPYAVRGILDGYFEMMSGRQIKN